MPLGLCAPARARVELREAEVAMGDEWPHASRLGKSQRPTIVALAALGVEPVGVSRDVPEQMLRVGFEPRMTRRRFDRAPAQPPRLVETAGPQSRAAERLVHPAALPHQPSRRLLLE